MATADFPSSCDNSKLPWWFNCTYRHGLELTTAKDVVRRDLYPQGTVKVCLHLLLSLWRTCPTASTAHSSLLSVIQQTNSKLGLPLQRKQAPQSYRNYDYSQSCLCSLPSGQGKSTHAAACRKDDDETKRHQQATEQINPWYHNT